MLVLSFIGLAYEGISSFLHQKLNKALHQAVRAMDSKTAMLLMYGIYNAETLEKLINTVHNIHNTTSLHQRLFVGQQSSLKLRSLYANSLGLHHYSINSLFIFENSARQVYCTIQGINNPAAHICISKLEF